MAVKPLCACVRVNFYSCCVDVHIRAECVCADIPFYLPLTYLASSII